MYEQLYCNSSPRVPHIHVGELVQHWFRWWLGACWAPCHYLNQCCLVVNWPLRNTIQWNSNQDTRLFIMKVHLKLSSAKTAAILFRGVESMIYSPATYPTQNKSGSLTVIALIYFWEWIDTTTKLSYLSILTCQTCVWMPVSIFRLMAFLVWCQECTYLTIIHLWSQLFNRIWLTKGG